MRVVILATLLGVLEECFSHLGCFSLLPPWKSVLRPIPAPMSPEDINVRIYCYLQADPNKRYEIKLRPEVQLGDTPFDRSLPTVFIIHGFASNGNLTWMNEMKNAYLSQVNANVMLVDWGPGAQLHNYLQVSGNTRVVGKELARMIKQLNINPKTLHLIGHSLGSHIAAYAGKEVPGTDRITALDPAQPAFEGHDKEVRLDEGDAVFIDVHHTDARPFFPFLGCGMMQPVGHVDFYINGGFDQPMCIVPPKLPKITSLEDLKNYTVEAIAKYVSCPHSRAYEYFIEALKSDDCVFWGYEAGIGNSFKSAANTLTLGMFPKLTALSPTCSKSKCVPMGLKTRETKLRGSFVVTTRGSSPYCIMEDFKQDEEEEEEQTERPKDLFSKFMPF